MCRSGFISLNVLLFFNLLCICIIIIISYMYLQMNMDQVDSGIKMLVEAIAEAQSSATNGSPPVHRDHLNPATSISTHCSLVGD